MNNYGYNIKRLYPMLLNILISNYMRKIMYLTINYNNINHKNFTYGFIEFINYTTVFNSPYLEFHIKCPFYYYNNKILILSFVRSYFIKDIINNNISIKQDNYNFVIDNLRNTFDLNDIEINIFKIKLKKIYKKHLNLYDSR